VQIDNKSGAYIATNHLLTLGRRRLLLLNDKSNSEFAIAKREGFRQALSEYGITYNDSMECGILPYEDTLAYKTIKKILNECQDKRPDALLVYGDWATYGAVTAIREAGLKIPEDIALVMYDDYPWVSKVLGLAVSAVRQPLEEQASHALTLLLERMEDSEETVNTIEILQPQLIVRRSCGSDLFH
jgi:DNA-binding LacI/PurR family transcriptional regulator